MVSRHSHTLNCPSLPARVIRYLRPAQSITMVLLGAARPVKKICMSIGTSGWLFGSQPSAEKRQSLSGLDTTLSAEMPRLGPEPSLFPPPVPPPVPVPPWKKRTVRMRVATERSMYKGYRLAGGRRDRLRYKGKPVGKRNRLPHPKRLG